MSKTFHELKKEIERFYKKQRELTLPSGEVVKFHNDGCVHIMFKGNKNKREYHEIESRFELFQLLPDLFKDYCVSATFRLVNNSFGCSQYLFYDLEWQDFLVDGSIIKVRVVFRKKVGSDYYSFYSIFGKKIIPPKEE
jgi:hypothetical protein